MGNHSKFIYILHKIKKTEGKIIVNTMGIDKKQIVTDLKPSLLEWLTCSICHDIVQDPVFIKNCEHYFCREHIIEWSKACCKMDSRGQVNVIIPTCPLCRTCFNPSTDLRIAKGLMPKLLRHISVRCPYGKCNRLIEYERLNLHKRDCQHRRVVAFKHTVTVYEVDNEPFERQGGKPWRRMTAEDKRNIRAELNEFKAKEMQVHKS